MKFILAISLLFKFTQAISISLKAQQPSPHPEPINPVDELFRKYDFAVLDFYKAELKSYLSNNAYYHRVLWQASNKGVSFYLRTENYFNVFSRKKRFYRRVVRGNESVYWLCLRLFIDPFPESRRDDFPLQVDPWLKIKDESMNWHVIAFLV